MEQKVDEMTRKGVYFDQYSGEIQTDEKGILRGGGLLIAWFREPSSNMFYLLKLNNHRL